MSCPMNWPRRAWLGAMLESLLVAGCGIITPTPADPKLARAVLREALEAWKEGQSETALSLRQPPIQTSDYRWREGVQLLRYEIGEDVRSNSFDYRCRVKLWLKTNRGTLVESATYTVSVNPTLVVVRDADGL